jgi:hypothetical protein
VTVDDPAALLRADGDDVRAWSLRALDLGPTVLGAVAVRGGDDDGLTPEIVAFHWLPHEIGR